MSGAGTDEDLERASAEGLGLFVRSLLGLDPQAVQEALSVLDRFTETTQTS